MTDDGFRPHPDGYPVKLVRDYIERLVGGSGEIEYRALGNHELHVSALRRKLIEEAAEYLENPTLSELADVLEVVRALAQVMHGTPLVLLDDIAKAKRDGRGGYSAGVAMWATHPRDRQLAT